MTVNAGREQILRKSGSHPKLLSQNRYTQHVAKWGPINIRRQITEFFRPADQAPWICAFLFNTTIFIHYIFKQIYTIRGYMFRLISETFKRPVYERSKLIIYTITYCSGSIFRRFLSVLVTHAILGCVTNSIIAGAGCTTKFHQSGI